MITDYNSNVAQIEPRKNSYNATSMFDNSENHPNNTPKYNLIPYLCKTIGLTSSIVGSQSLSLPIQNLLNLKYTNPSTSYWHLLKQRYNHEGVLGLYRGCVNNTKRRCSTVIAPALFATSFQENFDLSTNQTASLSATLETIFSYIYQEHREKLLMSGAKEQAPFNMKAILPTIWLRNYAFHSSIYSSKNLANQITESIPEDVFEKTDFTKKQFEQYSENCIKLMLITASTPLDSLATMLSGGNKFSDIKNMITENPTRLFSGGSARTCFSILASAAISAGLSFSKTIEKNIFTIDGPNR
ncbi:MAG: hypothetical protein ISQ32_04115 [Rickettsiales bacterium]|nr:hypothetical protein [Rickettsiales bacterium]